MVKQNLTTESVVKENLTSEYECASELLQCILDNPANRLTQNIRDMIETSIRLFRIQSKERTAYREALKEIVEVSEIKVTNTQTLVERMNRQKAALAKAKQLTEK